MIAWLALTALAADPPMQLHRIAGAGAPTQVGVRVDELFGGDSLVGTLELSARYGARRLSMGFHVPVAWFSEPAGRTAGLGNLRADLGWVLRSDQVTLQLGVEGWVHVGNPSWVWVDRFETTWPSAGGRAVMELRTHGETAFLMRVHAGAWAPRDGLAPGFAAPVVPNLALALGVDRAIHKQLGLAAEISGAWREPSPLELAIGLRQGTHAGVHMRAGVVLPLGRWAGLSPADAGVGVGGVREVTGWFELVFAPDGPQSAPTRKPSATM